MPSCPFCDPPPEQLIVVDGPCYAMWTGGAPEGSVMVLPLAHKETPFDLNGEEWEATKRLLCLVRDRVDDLHQPDGWNVGWNVQAVGGQSIPHAHCHLIPRYSDEPFAGRGLRWWIKGDDNRRPRTGRL